MSRAWQAMLGALRYGQGPLDLRSWLMRAAGALQGKRTVILDADPKLCGRVLAGSDTKGTILETLVATPAWHPIYSIESVDGELWQQLAGDFKAVMKALDWKRRLAPLARGEMARLASELRADEARVVDAEAISRVVLRVLYELVFEAPIAADDETLFYQASLQWRKEIAVKGRADAAVKQRFWERLGELVAASRFRQGLATYAQDPARWLSLFAQPLLISPQINVGDILVAVFHFLRQDEVLAALLTEWPLAKVQPAQGHLLSGRDNDNTQTATESWYQLRVFGRVLRASARLPRKQSTHKMAR